MGLVKFGNQTLSIDAIPDGHVVIADSEIANLRNSQNAYLLLKSKIPVGVDESSIPTVLEKGSKFDSTVAELTGVKTKLTETEGKLTKFANIPQDFTPEKWNQYKSVEADSVFASKFEKISGKVYERVKKEDGVDIKVDERFIDPIKLESWKPDDPQAEIQLYDILKEGYAAQVDFINKSQGSINPGGAPAAPALGANLAPQPTLSPMPNPASMDRSDAGGMKVTRFGRSI